MPVAEILIGAFITVLFEKLASSDLINFARSQGLHSQLQIWTNTLIQIKAVLVDAGQKHITDTAVQLWLKDLQVLAYDIDDLLDDLATEALHRRLTPESQTSTSKVRKLFHSFSPWASTIMYGRKMSSKLDEITTRLHYLVEMKNTLGLNVHYGSSSIADRRPEETSLLDESSVVGRKGDKEALLKKLLVDIEPCDQNVSIVPIVGMGGIGKTTLARLLYNDEAVKQHFELKAWVCVSDEFDIFMTSKIIFQAVTGENPEFADLNLLQVALQDKLSNKKFLLVLDDVWNENWENWERLQRPFRVGAPGSKIIVTTRSSKVVSTMGRIEVYPLEVLSSEDSSFLLAHHALGERNFDAHPAIKSYGEGIVKKCQGLPLALIALGRILSTKTDEEDWEELLNSEIWNLDEGSILPALRLSYHHLPAHLKQLFAYCSFFPKDYVFDKEELVLLWMAEGFLHKPNGRKSMESLGYEYLKELVSRSFFQNSANKDSEYLMHDLMNDLATSVAGEFFLRLDEKINVDERNEALDKLRHFSFVRQEYGVYKKFKALERAKRLRTFLSRPNFHNYYLSNKVLVDLLPQLEFLRVLSLNNLQISEVPESIGRMKHLRYLDVSRTQIKCLPGQVSDLYNLQTLSVRGCRLLTSLPNRFAKLINLRHFDNYDTPSLKNTPLGIGGLTSLQTLSNVIIARTNGFEIRELKGLSTLRGRLCIMGLHEVNNANHAKEANLQQKEGLDDLEMEWSNVFDDSRNESIEYKVIDGLKPHDKLRNLKIVGYGGRNFPSWVEDPYFFSQLTQLTLRGCRRCTNLPSLGHLTMLQKLVVESMDEVTIVGPELFGHAISAQAVAFPLLEFLEFRYMKGWEMWSTSGGNGNENFGLFPRLRNLVMTGCPKLVEVSIRLIPSLQVLKIEECCVEVLTSLVGAASSAISRLKMRNIEGLTRLDGGVLEHLGRVEEVSIRDCKEVKYLWKSEAEASNILVKLRKLKVRSCDVLVCLGEKEDVNFGSLFTSLRKVEITFCERLERYNCPDSVEHLMMICCNSVTSFPFKKGQKLPSSALKSLVISECEEKEDSLLLLNNSAPSIEALHIEKWSNLRSFPMGCFIHLTSLWIEECEGIESFPEMGFLGLRDLAIRRCENLKWFPDEELQSLTSLVWMRIINCESMDESFPRGLWPPKLTLLEIGGLKKPMSEWGQQNFPTSLVDLRLNGDNSGGVVSFAEGGNTTTTPSSPLLLPSSLTSLQIWCFENLESISEGLQHLTSLETLSIWRCPKLRDLPEMLLPSLSYLQIEYSPKLQERCSSSINERDNYRHLISQIPRHDVSDGFLYNS